MGLAGYGTGKLPKGEGMGVACVSSQERATASWTACVAHVAVSPSGEVKVKKLTVATDVGTQVHPDNIRAQVEGADRKSTRLNSSHMSISYAVFCLKKKNTK